MSDEVVRLRGEGRWEEALALTSDPLARADLCNEQALFTGSEQARAEAERELLRAEAWLELERGRVLHARFLAERVEDPRELERFERGLALARDSRDDRLAAEGLFWVGLFHQVVRGDHGAARPYLEDAYRSARDLGDRKLTSYAIRHLGFALAAEEDHHDAARRAFEESVRLREEEGFLPGVAAGLLTLGELAAEHGDAERARELLERARALAEQVGAAPFLARIDAVRADLP